MEKLDFQNNITKLNKTTMDTFQDNIENAINEIPNAFDYGLGTQCKPKTGDWNDTCGNSSGFYMGMDLSNAPTTGWVYVIHLVHNELFAKQIALAFFSTDMWIRQKNNGEWSEWTKLH